MIYEPSIKKTLNRLSLIACGLSMGLGLSSLAARADGDHAHTIPSSSLATSQRLEMYHDAVTRAALDFVETVPEAQREALLFPFDSAARFSGTETENTPSFCAVLAWCQPWGLQQGVMQQDQLIAMNKLLATALSTGGYQTFLAVMNRHRILGEIEEVATADFMEKVEAECPDIKGGTLFELYEQCPNAGMPQYVSLAGAKTPTNGVYDMTWVWKEDPGLEKRRDQFDAFAIAIFGDIGSDDWAIRFEGHHATLNIHMHRDPKTGRVSVANTPIFLGSSPVIIPQDPIDHDITQQWNWTKGQVLLYATIQNVRAFWMALPEDVQAEAFVASDNFQQHGHLRVETFPPWLLSALEPSIDADAINSYSYVKIDADKLPAEAVWRLEQTFKAYFNNMNSAVADQYQNRLNKALINGDEITLAWAGGELENLGGQHFSYIRVGDLLLEFQQSNQWSAQHDPEHSGNHVHSILRDLTYDWDFDPLAIHMTGAGHRH